MELKNFIWKFVSKDKFKPAMCGVYMDPEEKARREAYQKEHPWPKKRLDEIFLPMLINPDVEDSINNQPN